MLNADGVINENNALLNNPVPQYTKSINIDPAKALPNIRIDNDNNGDNLDKILIGINTGNHGGNGSVKLFK